VITVQNTRILISNTTFDQIKSMLNSLSIWSNELHRYVWSAYLYDEEQDIYILPRGYSLSKIKYYLPDHTIKFDTTSNSFRNITLKMKCNPKDDLQFHAINYLLNNDNDLVRQKFLCLKTGKGKTYCTINYIANSGKVAMIIVDRDDFIKQWKNEFLKFTNIKEDQIYSIAGSNTIDKIMNMDGREVRKYKIFLASHRTLGVFNEKDYKNVDKLFTKIGLGIKVYDEAHVEWKNQFYIDCGSNVYSNIYLTATPNRSNPSEDKLFKSIYSSCPVFGLEDKYKDKYVNICYVTWNSNPDQLTEANMSTNYGFDANGYSDYLLYQRYDKLLNIVFKLIDSLIKDKKDRKIAFIFKKNNIIDKLYADLVNKYPNIKFGKFCGLTKKKEKMQELDNQIILSTSKSFEKGIDVKGLEVVINFMTFSSKIIAEQSIGRLRFIENTKLYYFDITDLGFGMCKHQAYYRRQIFNKIAKKSYNLEL